MNIIAEIKKILPVTRFLCLGTLGVTVAVKLEMLDPYTIFFDTRLVFMRLQVCNYNLLLFSLENQVVDMANINILPPG